jgi:O-antigen ligase
MLSSEKGQASIGIIAIVFFAMLLILLLFLGVPLKHAVATVGGAAVFAIAFINLDVALVILIFSMLLSPELQAGGVGGGRAVKIRIDDIFIIVIFCGWIAKMAINKEMGLLKHTRLSAPIFAYIIICCFASFLGVVAGRTNVKSAFFYLFKYIEYFLLFFMVANNMKTVRQAKRYVFFLLLTCFFVLLYAGAQTESRVSAPFESAKGGEPNTLAGYLILMTSIMVAFMLYPSSLRIKVLLMILICVSATVFLRTLSRSGWLSAFPAALTLVALSERAKRAQMIVILLLAAFILPAVAPSSVRDRIAETFTPYREYKMGGKKFGVDESTTQRIDSWKVGINRWMYKPVFGYGIPAGAVIDNQYMRVLNETGVIGFAVFIWMLYTIFCVIRDVFENSGDDKFKKALSMGLMSGFMGLLLLSSAAAVFILIRIMEPFWFLVAIVITLPELASDESDVVPAQEAPA